MNGETRERWIELCAQAVIEQDSQRLLNLVRQITQLLDEKEARLKGRNGKAKSRV
jgi:hypothetical protein